MQATAAAGSEKKVDTKKTKNKNRASNRPPPGAGQARRRNDDASRPAALGRPERQPPLENWVLVFSFLKLLLKATSLGSQVSHNHINNTQSRWGMKTRPSRGRRSARISPRFVSRAEARPDYCAAAFIVRSAAQAACCH